MLKKYQEEYIIEGNGNNIKEDKKSTQNISGDDSEVEIPVPIPNTAVKHFSANNTWELPPWKNRVLPENIL